MKALVTGASGFLGSHTVKALVDAGHEVRAASRSAERVRRALAPLGCVDRVEVFEADVTVPRQVDDALSGCEAVVHGAAIYTLDVRRRGEMLDNNPRGAEVVLGKAREQSLDPVIHVSSYVALLPVAGTLNPDSPVGRPPGPYALSKARSEEIARRLQAEGAPVTITYPGMVWGPNDPTLGESARLAREVLKGTIPTGSPGAVPVVDIRDVAAVHAAALRPGQGPRRYVAVSELVPMVELMRIVAEAGGRRAPRGKMPAPLILGLARSMDLFQRVVPRRLPLSHESIWTTIHGPTCDASSTTRELGVKFRPAAETLRDTVAWLRAGSTTG
jgi:dihydroflavonol-4-reductase